MADKKKSGFFKKSIIGLAAVFAVGVGAWCYHDYSLADDMAEEQGDLVDLQVKMGPKTAFAAVAFDVGAKKTSDADLLFIYDLKVALQKAGAEATLPARKANDLHKIFYHDGFEPVIVTSFGPYFNKYYALYSGEVSVGTGDGKIVFKTWRENEDLSGADLLALKALRVVFDKYQRNKQAARMKL